MPSPPLTRGEGRGPTRGQWGKGAQGVGPGQQAGETDLCNSVLGKQQRLTLEMYIHVQTLTCTRTHAHKQSPHPTPARSFPGEDLGGSLSLSQLLCWLTS